MWTGHPYSPHYLYTFKQSKPKQLPRSGFGNLSGTLDQRGRDVSNAQVKGKSYDVILRESFERKFA
jgi:hypothetical protein